MKTVPTVGGYLVIAAALLALLAATLAAAFLDLGAFNTPVALSISAAKAALIIMFFMHLRASTGLAVLFACAGVFWLAIMLALAMSDYLTR